MDAANNVLTFLIHTLFTLYVGALLLRIILSSVRADFYNPLSQFLVTITNPPLVPLRRVLPSVGRVDTASWVLAFGLKALELVLLLGIRGFAVDPLTLLIQTLLGIITTLVMIFLYAIIIRAILSWFTGPYTHQNPMIGILNAVTDPVLRPVRRVIPPVGMFDLSAFIAILILYSILIVLQSI